MLELEARPGDFHTADEGDLIGNLKPCRAPHQEAVGLAEAHATRRQEHATEELRGHVAVIDVARPVEQDLRRALGDQAAPDLAGRRARVDRAEVGVGLEPQAAGIERELAEELRDPCRPARDRDVRPRHQSDPAGEAHRRQVVEVPDAALEARDGERRGGDRNAGVGEDADADRGDGPVHQRERTGCADAHRQRHAGGARHAPRRGCLLEADHDVVEPERPEVEPRRPERAVADLPVVVADQQAGGGSRAEVDADREDVREAGRTVDSPRLGGAIVGEARIIDGDLEVADAEARRDRRAGVGHEPAFEPDAGVRQARAEREGECVRVDREAHSTKDGDRVGLPLVSQADARADGRRERDVFQGKPCHERPAESLDLPVHDQQAGGGDVDFDGIASRLRAVKIDPGLPGERETAGRGVRRSRIRDAAAGERELEAAVKLAVAVLIHERLARIPDPVAIGVGEGFAPEAHCGVGGDREGLEPAINDDKARAGEDGEIHEVRVEPGNRPA